ncbi:hypothetical protein SUGI_0696200 [Cryptomeria japonica]|nr:hypothetical protein SUGI_0696200 [Cryptomeria japonica]
MPRFLPLSVLITKYLVRKHKLATSVVKVRPLVVPKISKMDRASILGYAIENLKELLQQANDLHMELK